MRKLASIQRIRKVLSIENADLIEEVMVNDWKIVTAKNNGFKEGDLIIYLEIDSFVPTAIAPFLTPEGHEPRFFNGISGERLRSKKLRGVISQGLILPVSILDGMSYELEEDFDVTELLGIQKYEPPIDNSTGTKAQTGRAAGNFPTFVHKTSEERCQNLTRYWNDIKSTDENHHFQITEKLDGMSVTMYYNDGHLGVCSRNWEVKDEEQSDLWKVIHRYEADKKFMEFCNDNPFSKTFALQGEFVGPKSQGNKYKLDIQDIRWFSLFDIHSQKYLSHHMLEIVSSVVGMQTVPLLYTDIFLPVETISDMVLYAEGKSVLNPKVEREGVVVRKINTKNEAVQSFKVISNRFLLKLKD
jgi:RNA ligase (TIGR02306 family)